MFNKKHVAAAVLAPLLAMTLAMPVLASDGGQKSEFNGGEFRSKVAAWVRHGWWLKKLGKKDVLPLDPACMSSAVDKRDTAIIADLDTKNAALKTALETRRTALKAAWALTDADDRFQALKDAWKAYASSVKEAVRTFKTAKKDAWSQYHQDRLDCQIPVEQYPEPEGSDEQL